MSKESKGKKKGNQSILKWFTAVDYRENNDKQEQVRNIFFSSCCQ